MNTQQIVKDTLNLVGLSINDKPSARSKISYFSFIEAILDSKDLTETSRKLNISEDVLYKTLSKYISKVIPEKPHRVLWKQYILNLNNLKECQQCSRRLPLSQYVKNCDTWDGFAYICRECKAKFRKAFTEKNPNYSKEHYIANSYAYKENAARYKATLLNATPAWADKEKITKVYKECQEGFHVDHIYPLQSDWVCGLHVEYNLRCIPAQENLSKSNKFIPEIHK